MGIYGQYLGSPIAQNMPALTQERQKQLKEISTLRKGRDVLVFAADLTKETNQTSISYVDILPISDQISDLKGEALDLILETPGGAGEAAEDIVRILRKKYKEIAVIIPGWAKSAGTIMAMAADEILMGPTSALGPIDAQLTWQGKRFSAEALLEGMKKIKKEVDDTGVLNKAYIPILQGISPGELQNAQNGLDFATLLVTEWLVRYKFKNWTVHSSTNQPVTDNEKQQRAKEIAEQLCDHKTWLTHGRSIKIDDLRKMRLLITDYSDDPKLEEAIRRYHALLQMTFSSNTYKIYETPTSQIYKFLSPNVPAPPSLNVPGSSARASVGPIGANIAQLGFQCSKCSTKCTIQANLVAPQQLLPGRFAFPATNNKFLCPKCGVEHDLSDARRQIEAQTSKPVV